MRILHTSRALAAHTLQRVLRLLNNLILTYHVIFIIHVKLKARLVPRCTSVLKLPARSCNKDMSRSNQQSKTAAGASLVSGQAASSPAAPLAHQTQGLFGANQSIFTPAQPPPPSHSDEAGRANTEDLHSQLASLQEAVRVLSQGRVNSIVLPVARTLTSTPKSSDKLIK